MDAEQLIQDVLEGELDAEELGRLVIMLAQKLDAANQRIAELEQQLAGQSTPKVDEPYSVDSEEKRQQEADKQSGGKKKKKKKKKSSGRRRTQEKLKQAEREENVYPAGVPVEQCKLSHSRPVWRFENGRAVLVAYHVYRGPGKQYGQVAALGRSEYGIEIVIALAYLIYILGLSLDKACQLLRFFMQLPINKSQADALLYRLAQEWEDEFEVICTLLAHSAVVHADETSWSINSVWAFLSEHVRVLLFGVHKDGPTLKAILNPADFTGVIVSDNAAVYGNFTTAQKCWAHLLRKAIKLTLLDPTNGDYRRFCDGLFAIYRSACRSKRDRRYSDDTRRRKVADLDDEIFDLCLSFPCHDDDTPPATETEADFQRLVSEVFRLMMHQELFVFVVHADVGATNNEAERTLRNPAQARKTGRTSKTVRGARRQSIIHSVLESLRRQVPEYSLASVVSEVKSWWQSGRSCFRRLAASLGIPPPGESVLNRVLPTAA